MNKSYYSLGLMSGTSGDGVDASIIQSDGDTEYKVILDKYFKYSQEIYENIHSLKDKINNSKDLKNLSKESNSLEEKITIFHANAANEIFKKNKNKIDFIGFHGQTIFHNAKERISKQLGDGKLLSKLTKKTVIYNFRENDLKNGGQGAPLAPIFHKLMVKKNKIKLPVCVLNLGGIANVSLIETYNDDFFSSDVGPGNCLIDEWMRKNSEAEYDKDGSTAQAGKINKKIFDTLIMNITKKNKLRLSLDSKDFDLSFVDGLSLQDGAATLTEFTSKNIVNYFSSFFEKEKKWQIIVCGGGRKNKFLMKCLKDSMLKNISLQLIDDYGIDGDFVESQAFAYLAIRSFLNLPISFPKTTGVNKPCVGGNIFKS